MSTEAAELYSVQGTLEQIHAHIEAGRLHDAGDEATAGVMRVGEFLDNAGYIPSEVPTSNLYDRLYEAQGGLDQIRVYLEASKSDKAANEARNWIGEIADSLECVGYVPPLIPSR